MRRLAMLWGAVVLFGLFAPACSYDEGYFRRKLKQLDELAAKGTDTARKRINKRKSELVEAFKKLPRGEDRQDALDALCRRARKTVKEAEKILAGEAVEEKRAEDPKELAEYQKKFVGRWEGEHMKLAIAPNGKVSYRRRKPGGGASRIDAFILEFHRDRFKVGFMGLGTNFRIDRAPYREGGRWKMKIDGVLLTRVDDVAASQPASSQPTAGEEATAAPPAAAQGSPR